MNWSSVKNLLIAILVAANLFLIYNIVRQDLTRSYVSDSEIHDAIELLAERGFSVPAESVPVKKFKTPVYESLYDAEYYTQVAEALSDSEREMLYTLPNGDISISTKSGAWMEFNDEFAFKYSKFDIPDISAYTEITADNFESAAKQGNALSVSRMNVLSSYTNTFLCKQLSKDSPLSVDILSGFLGTDGYTYLLARQMLDGYEVYSHYAVCVFDENELVFSHGSWYFSDVDKDYTTELCDQINILFVDMATLKSSADGEPSSVQDEQASVYEPSEQHTDENVELPALTSMTPCYAVYWNANKTALYFIPAWQIDHNNSLTIVYNAANSTVYSTNK